PDNGSYGFGQSRIVQAGFEALDQCAAAEEHLGVGTGKRNYPAYSDPANGYAHAFFMMTLHVGSEFENPRGCGMRIELKDRLHTVVLALGPDSSGSDYETKAPHQSRLDCGYRSRYTV